MVATASHLPAAAERMVRPPSAWMMAILPVPGP